MGKKATQHQTPPDVAQPHPECKAPCCVTAGETRREMTNEETRGLLHVDRAAGNGWPEPESARFAEAWKLYDALLGKD